MVFPKTLEELLIIEKDMVSNLKCTEKQLCTYKRSKTNFLEKFTKRKMYRRQQQK